jgi:fumarate reductase flavoprotein subunit
MIKRSAVWLLVIAAALVTLTGCPPGIEAGEVGPFSALGRKAGYNGQVTVIVTMDPTYTNITAVTAEGPGETPAIGGRALSELPPKMVDQNKVTITDTISGATFTSKAVKDAAKEAYDQLIARKSP